MSGLDIASTILEDLISSITQQCLIQIATVTIKVKARTLTDTLSHGIGLVATDVARVIQL